MNFLKNIVLMAILASASSPSMFAMHSMTNGDEASSSEMTHEELIEETFPRLEKEIKLLVDRAMSGEITDRNAFLKESNSTFDRLNLLESYIQKSKPDLMPVLKARLHDFREKITTISNIGFKAITDANNGIFKKKSDGIDWDGRAKKCSGCSIF